MESAGEVQAERRSPVQGEAGRECDALLDLLALELGGTQAGGKGAAAALSAFVSCSRKGSISRRRNEPGKWLGVGGAHSSMDLSPFAAMSTSLAPGLQSATTRASVSVGEGAIR